MVFPITLLFWWKIFPFLSPLSEQFLFTCLWHWYVRFDEFQYKLWIHCFPQGKYWFHPWKNPPFLVWTKKKQPLFLKSIIDYSFNTFLKPKSILVNNNSITAIKRGHVSKKMFFVFTSTGIDEEKEIGFSSVFSILWKNSIMETQYKFLEMGKNKNKIIIILGLDIMTK